MSNDDYIEGKLCTYSFTSLLSTYNTVILTNFALKIHLHNILVFLQLSPTLHLLMLNL